MQNALTVVIPVLPGHAEDLKTLLTAVGRGDDPARRIDFSALSRIHFARWVVVDAPTSPQSASLLAFGTDHDGDDASLLAELHAQAATVLGQIYNHCEGAPTDLATNASAFLEYMLRRRVPYAARYVGYRNHSVPDIKNALAVRDEIEDFLDRAAPPGGYPPGTNGGQIAEDVARFAQSQAAIRPVHSPHAINSTIARVAFIVLLILAGMGALGLYSWKILLCMSALFVVVAGLRVAVWWRQLRQAEEQDAKSFTPPPPVIDAGDLILQEDFVVQNQMTHVVPIKPGPLRQTTLRIVLRAINLLAEIYYTRGELGGIATIHFARWMLIDGGKRLLFFSNFDGSWERYLGDFVDKAHVGLTAVWSNTAGFPPTKNLILDGASNVDVFKAWTREYQVPTQVWYSAYPFSSVTNIRDSISFRDAVASRHRSASGPRAEEAARVLLQKL